MGNSKFTPDMLSDAIEATKKKIADNSEQIADYELKVGNQQTAIDNLDYYYNNFRSWADEYQYASKEQKKMIACNLLKEVRIAKDYNIEIVFDMNYKQFLDCAETSNKPTELKIAS